MRPGLIQDEDGQTLGEHEGATTFTIGQRKGLRIERPAADGRPRYVLGIDPQQNTVTVGPQEALAVDELEGIRTTWAGPAPEDMGETEDTGIDCEVQIRAHSDPVPARAWLGEVRAEAPEAETDPLGPVVPRPRPAGQVLRVAVDEPMHGVAPGQTMVIYRGTRVLGQATIDRSRSRARA
jgi:tRNA-specific 2-thiouridylase